MSRSVEVTCDYCTCSYVSQSEIDLLEWLSVDFYDTISEEHKELDFCCNECAVSYLS